MTATDPRFEQDALDTELFNMPTQRNAPPVEENSTVETPTVEEPPTVETPTVETPAVEAPAVPYMWLHEPPAGTGPHVPQLPPRNHTGLKIIGGTVAAILIAAVAVGIGYMGGAASHSTPTNPTTPTTGATSTQAAIRDWSARGGYNHIQAITASLKTVGQYGAVGNVPSMRYGCQDLGINVDAAINYGPIPDAETQRHWSTALAYFKRASQECTSGIDYMNAGLLQQATSDIQSATTELQWGTARMNQINSGGN